MTDLLRTITIGLVLSTPCPGWSDDVPTGDLERWSAVYSATAADIGMEFADDLGGKLMLVEKALLQYANPVRGVEQHGTIHLWTDGGRPAIVGSIWSRTSPNRAGYRRVNFEWHTLSTRPVRARYGDETYWETSAAGVEWRKLDDLPAPGPNRSIRLLQMRRIAAAFDAEIERGESELRMLPRPLYRYPETAEGVVDGAMFAYVMGTDPEFFVLLEARTDAGGARGWHAAIARFTNSGLEVTRSKLPWWSCERFRAGPRDQTYFLRFNVTELPADLAGTEFDTNPSNEGEE